VRPGIANRALRCMDSVVPEDVIVFVWSGRAENELGIGQRFEFDRVARRLASREVPVSQFVQGSIRRPMRWRPRGGVSRWGLVKGDASAARCIPDQGGRALERRHFFRGLVDTYGHARFEFGRQPDPVRTPAGS
jgi:hypothetical protein